VFMGLSLRYVPPSDRATAAGLHQAVYAVRMLVGPWGSEMSGDVIRIRWMFVVSALLCLVLSSGMILAVGKVSAHRRTWEYPEGRPEAGPDRL